MSANKDYLNYPIPQTHQTHRPPNFQPQKKKRKISWGELISGAVLIGGGLYCLSQLFQGNEDDEKKKGEEYLLDACSRANFNCDDIRDVEEFKTESDLINYVEQKVEKLALQNYVLTSGKSGDIVTNQKKYDEESMNHIILKNLNMKLREKTRFSEDIITRVIEKSCNVYRCKMGNQRYGSAGEMTIKNGIYANYINTKK